MPTSEQHPDTNAGAAEDVVHSGQPAAHDEKRQGPAAVGIGASAGGLTALKQFFGGVPEKSGLVFVVVMHLSPEHESHLADLLQPHTPMPVQQVTETTRLEADRVYVIPPGRNLNAIDTHLRLSSLEEKRRERAPIDHFFRTLAASHDGHAIGVILTGTGSNGTLGIKEIKMKGGLTVVQAPAEAEYDGMPQSAIVSGLVDLVLPLAEMPAEIIRFAHTEPRITVPEDGDEVGAREEERLLQKIFALVRAHTDRDFNRYKRSTIMRRIRRRMQMRSTEVLEGYLELLRQDVGEVRALADDFLITVTNFFRDREVFEQMEHEVIPGLFAGRHRDDSVRVWSVGCATGEEAYSLAMLLVEEAERHEDPPRLQVFASDLHERSLTKAREGFYSGDIEHEVSPERLRRFFEEVDGGYRIRKELRELVVFAPHNLLGDPPFSKLDLIACRNVLIYLQREVQRDVVELFHYALRPDGHLVLGTAETVEGSDLFRIESKKHCVYRRRSVPPREPHLPVFPVTRRPRLPEHEGHAERTGEPVHHGMFHQKMVEQYAPPSLLVSPDHKVVHLSEHAGRYLIHPGGEPTTSIFKLVREELRIELRAALRTASECQEATRTKPIGVQIDGEPRSVVVHVRPALEPEQEGFSLVIFDERGAGGPGVGEGSAGERSAAERVTRDATAPELELTKKRLQSIIEEYETSQEEMKASNECLQSSSEELRSTMEELETSKEELQSMNEELQTVNQENRHKVEELAQLSGDLQNLMAATDIATLFLDRDLRILRFTPQVGELFNVRTTDRGRPISDLTHCLGYDDLQEDARRVLKKLVPIEREVQDEEGRWYLTRVLPYRSTDDRIEGIVITFVDITERVEAEHELRESEERLRRVLDIANVGVLFFDAGGNLVDTNEAFLEITGYTWSDVESGDLTWRTLTPEEWVPASEEQLRKLKATGKIGPYEKEYWCQDGSRKWMLFAGASLGDDLIVEHCIDVSERKEAEQALRELNETLEEQVTERTRQVRALASKLTMAEQAERHRISQVLHDDLQQLLYGLQLKMTFIRQSAEADERERMLHEVDEAEGWLADAVTTTRRLTVDLSPPVLEGDGLADALQWLQTQMRDLHDLQVELEAEHAFYIPGQDMRVLLFQIVRELLFNVVKHAQVESAVVALREGEEDGHLIIEVTDRGQGFDVEAVEVKEAGGGFGLFSVRERLGLFGGRMQIASTPGEGTRVTIYAPVEPQTKRTDGQDD